MRGLRRGAFRGRKSPLFRFAGGPGVAFRDGVVALAAGIAEALGQNFVAGAYGTSRLVDESGALLEWRKGALLEVGGFRQMVRWPGRAPRRTEGAPIVQGIDATASIVDFRQSTEPQDRLGLSVRAIQLKRRLPLILKRAGYRSVVRRTLGIVFELPHGHLRLYSRVRLAAGAYRTKGFQGLAFGPRAVVNSHLRRLFAVVHDCKRRQYSALSDHHLKNYHQGSPPSSSHLLGLFLCCSLSEGVLILVSSSSGEL